MLFRSSISLILPHASTPTAVLQFVSPIPLGLRSINTLILSLFPAGSKTGQESIALAPSFPRFLPGMLITVCKGFHVFPPSVDLRITKFMWFGASFETLVRWSAPAISVPMRVFTRDGIL